ncbi:Uncharacterised protein [uncultured archaeon]|nr:Uncharacterised protein [uncultured archaeon]
MYGSNGLFSSNLSTLAPEIFDHSEAFGIDIPKTHLINYSEDPDSSVITAGFNSLQSVAPEYPQPVEQHIETIKYAGKSIPDNTITLNCPSDIAAHSEKPHKKGRIAEVTCPELYETVLEHYLTRCIANILPNIVDGVYLSDNKPLEVGKENKKCPGLFLAFSRGPIEKLIGDGIVSQSLKFGVENFPEVSEITDYLRRIEGEDGICLVTKDDSGVNIGLKGLLLNVPEMQREKYLQDYDGSVGGRTNAGIFAATLDEIYQAFIIKESNYKHGAGNYMELSKNGLEREVHIEYVLAEVNEELAERGGYHARPNDIQVVDTNYVRDAQGRLLEKVTTKRLFQFVLRSMILITFRPKMPLLKYAIK